MEIKKEKKMGKVVKRVSVFGLVFAFCLAVALTIALSVPKGEQVSTNPVEFGLPMNSAVVVKDYANDRLQDNETLKRWEIHLAVDLASEDSAVFSVADGVVTSIKDNSLEGTVVTIQHADGFVSVYSSLDQALSISQNASVTRGQQIGVASTHAANESGQGAHLHFMLLKDGMKVDPNNYLDLQNK